MPDKEPRAILEITGIEDILNITKKGVTKLKKTMIMSVLMLALTAASFAQIGEKMVDTFEKNLDLKSPEWWKFGNVTLSVVSNPAYRPGDTIGSMAGKYSLNIKGSANNYYCGGMGTYLGLDATRYTGLQMNVYGYGEGSGKIKIELYDDDKGSYQTQFDKNWTPIKDDVWSFEQNVDWRGWKTVIIPFSSFTLTNPGRGDGVRNFDQDKGSGGLLQAQFILLAGSPDGEVNMNIDNLKLYSDRSATGEE